MTLRKRIFGVLLVVFLLVTQFYFSRSPVEGNMPPASLIVPKQTLQLWYTDEELTDYLSGAALAFYEEKDIRVLPTLVSGVEYLETIYEASVRKGQGPDLYVLSNDSMEKAYLAGVAVEVAPDEDIINETNFPRAALHAVTYKDKKVAYPFYYETNIFLYNDTYIEDWMRNRLVAENPDSEISQDEVRAAVEGNIPNSMSEILNFANEYDAPENVEAVLRWDVSDIFYNYFFVGNSINVGGEAGDNPAEIDIYNQATIDSLKVYQALNQFFSIDAKAVSYEGVMQEFLEGKLVLTIATTDAVEMIEQAKKEGRFPYEYGIATLPDISESLPTRGMSVTNGIMINGFSKQQETANEFAEYLTMDAVDTLYPRAGKLPAVKNASLENAKIAKANEEYETSVPVTKMLEASNFWIQLEMCFTKIWTGESVNDQLRLLSEQIKTQVTGEPFTEELIPEPETTVTEPEEIINEIEETNQNE